MNIDNQNIAMNNYDDDLDFEWSEWIESVMNNDFVLQISNGTVLPINHPHYNKDRTEIEIFSSDFIHFECSIQIDGNVYNVTQNTFNKIKKIIDSNFEALVSFAKEQKGEYISQNLLLGCSRNIFIKYGQLIININGAINGSVGNFCEKFIAEMRNLIINDEDEFTNFMKIEEI